jgi:hypothetical protein
MNRSLLKLIIAVAIVCAVAPAASASAAAKNCVPKKGAKTNWHQNGARSYSIKSKHYACSNKYGKRFRLEAAEFESDSFGAFQTNGRYLFYIRSFEGATASHGSIGRLLDLKTGDSTKRLGPRDIDFATVPECLPVEVYCSRSAQGAAIGPGRSFVIGYWMPFDDRQAGKRIGEQFWVERHCFAPGLVNPVVTVLDRVSSSADLASIRSDHGVAATWTNAGVKKSAPFC